jgi:hypothetical protein
MTASSRTAHKAPRSRSKTHRSSARYSRTSRHSRKSPLFYKHTKTFGAHSLSFPRKLETTHAITGRSQKKRLPRATATQDSSRLNQKIFHLPDGPAQRARDEAMRAAMVAELEDKPIRASDGNPNQWADRSKSRVQFDYDAYAEVEQWWTDGGQQSIEALGGHSYNGYESSSGMVFKSLL